MPQPQVLGPDGEPRDGAHDYRILDHGGLIVAAPIAPTTEIYYTVDEGLTNWDSFQVGPRGCSCLLLLLLPPPQKKQTNKQTH